MAPPPPRSRSPHDSDFTQRIPYLTHTPLHATHDRSHIEQLHLPRSPNFRMTFELLPSPTSQPTQSRPFRRWKAYLHAQGIRGTGVVVGALIFASLFFYTISLSPHGSLWHRLPNWRSPSQLDLGNNESLLLSSRPTPTVPLASPSPSPTSDVLPLERVRNIVASTKGFFCRDYSLGLGWNNMRYIIDAAVIQAQILNRTLVLPSFVYARACEYNITVCAQYAPMVNKGDAIGWDEWRELPYEQQMGFRIPISLMLDLPRLRQRHAVITASDYLRLHGQDPESESSSGFWSRESYISHHNVFEPNKMPTQFVIENGWYAPQGVIRVDYIPQAMKDRGKWEPHPESEIPGSERYVPLGEPTEISNRLTSALSEGQFVMSWDTAKSTLRTAELAFEVDLDNDQVVESVLNDNGWEVLHTFQGVLGMDFAKTVVQVTREVVPRSAIRGFRDDYYHLDADVLVLAGETHLSKPSSMRFTEPSSRAHFTDMVVHSIRAPAQFFDLAERLALRMREMNGGRQWMGAHMRRGDFVRLGWAMEPPISEHVKRVKDRLEKARVALTHLSNLSTYDLEGVKPNLEQITVPPPLVGDHFYIATDARDPDELRIVADAGAVFLWDLLTMEDRRAFGWPLMFTDVRAVVEQAVLAHSGFFYGHSMSSFAGVIVNMRAALGCDPRMALLD